MPINWQLASQPGSFDNALAMGYQFGQDIRKQREEKEFRNALAGYDPNNPETIKPIMQADPRLGFQLQREQASMQRQQQEQKRATMPILGKLLDFASESPENWQQALQIAPQYGIDVSNVPQQFDPEWAKQQSAVMSALATPQGQEIMSAAGKQAYDEGLRPGDGRFEQRVNQIWQQNSAIPYTDAQGATRLYIPGQQQGGPEVGAIVKGHRFRGGNPNDPASWEPVGGAASNGSNGFPASQ